jgi:hypothetical protein
MKVMGNMYECRVLTRNPEEEDHFQDLDAVELSTQPLTEMSIRNLPGGKKRPAHRADNLSAIYEPNV